MPCDDGVPQFNTYLQEKTAELVDEQRRGAEMLRLRYLLDQSGIPPDIERGFIGDVFCRYNAKSPYLRCAVNPCGSCENCSHRKVES